MKIINFRKKPQNFYLNLMEKDIEEGGKASRWLLDYTCYLRNIILSLEKK